jgi:hypothetical protein
MKTILVLGSYLSLVATCSAQTVLAEYDWQKLAQNGQLRGGEATSMDGKSALKIVNRNETPLQLQLLKIPKPPISKKLYAITGEVKYEGIRGDGYLEMWNFFPPLQSGMPEGQYFSRTLGVGGEMGKLSGTSDWRAFMLPFDGTGGSGSPTRLEINIFLPAQGTVFLGPVKLVEYTGSFASMGIASSNAWWSDRAAGVVGGIGGGVIGCLGGLLGWLAWKRAGSALCRGSFVAADRSGGCARARCSCRLVRKAAICGLVSLGARRSIIAGNHSLSAPQVPEALQGLGAATDDGNGCNEGLVVRRPRSRSSDVRGQGLKRETYAQIPLCKSPPGIMTGQE